MPQLNKTKCRICSKEIPALKESDHFELTYCEKCEKERQSKYQPLFNHLSNEHDLILIESELQEIINIVKNTK